MTKNIFAIVLIMFSQLLLAEDVSKKWHMMLNKCESALIEGELKEARELALELIKIDPSDTQVMYYLVLTSVELNIPVPKWLIEEPWPNATEKDRNNYKRAMKAINGT
jgi:hypothetical protein